MHYCRSHDLPEIIIIVISMMLTQSVICRWACKQLLRRCHQRNPIRQGSYLQCYIVGYSQFKRLHAGGLATSY
jgi:hypothetical protein